MTQLTVSIENPDMLRDITKAIRMIRGVVSVKPEKAKPNATTLAAIKEVQSGDSIQKNREHQFVAEKVSGGMCVEVAHPTRMV